MKPQRNKCAYCEKDRERCRIVSVREVFDRPEVEWVCPQCWKEFELDNYLYEKEGRIR